jgi:formiminotetrahydrofolate cyclodeaminase
MRQQFTRREAATAFVASAAALSAQSPNAPLPQNSDEELQAARKSVRQNLEQLAKFPLQMATEPAVHFKA